MIFFRAMPCHYFSVPRFSVPCRANIFCAMIFRAGPCHKSAGPPCRAGASLESLPSGHKVPMRATSMVLAMALSSQAWSVSAHVTTFEVIPIAPPWVDKQLGGVGAEPGRGPFSDLWPFRPIKKINGISPQPPNID